MLIKYSVMIFSLSIINNIYAQEDDYVTISNCRDRGKQIFKPTEVIEITPEWKTDEQELIHNYKWTYEIKYIPHFQSHSEKIDPTQFLKPIDEGDAKKLLILNGILTPNDYNITVFSKRKPNVKEGPDNALHDGYKLCRIHIGALGPIAVISGGYEKRVPTGFDVLVSAEESFDLNYRGKVKSGLEYKWFCRQTHGPETLCNREVISREVTFTIPAEKLIDGDFIYIFLNVTLAYMPTKPSKAVTQILSIRHGVPYIEIKKNCLSSTDFANYEKITMLQVTCRRNCEGIKEQDYNWKLIKKNDKSFVFDYSKSRYGQTGSKFLIEKGALTEKGPFIIQASVTTTRGRGRASITIMYHSQVTVRDCRLRPLRGMAAKTYFQFSCEQRPKAQENFYEFFVIDATDMSVEQLIVSGFYPDVFRRRFKLPPTKEKHLYVEVKRITDELNTTHPARIVQVDGDVESAFSKKSAEEVLNLLHDMYHGNGSTESITDLVKSGKPEDRDKAVELFGNIVDELVISKIQNQEMKDFVQTLKYTASTDMLHAPLASLDEIIKLSHSMTELQHKNIPPETDPLLAKFTTTLCKKMMDKSLEIMQKIENEDALKMSAEMERLSRITTKCFEAHTNPNFGIIKSFELNITTEPSNVDVPEIIENYANYVDHDDSYYNDLDNLNEATFNIINGSVTAAKMVAMATATGEGLVRTAGTVSESVVFKEYGYDLAVRPIESNGVVVTCSIDFKEDDHSYDLLMTTWTKDILWWNPAFIKAHTDIVNVEMWHSTCKERINSFKHPFSIYFTMKNRKFTPRTTEYTFQIPEAYSTMSDDELNYHIQVHQIALPKKQLLSVNFHGLNTSGILYVVLQDEFPSVEDFDNTTKLQPGHKSILQLANNYGYDILAYIGILVDRKKEVEGTTLTYEISSTVTCCMQFVQKENRWIPQCEPSEDNSNETTIHCDCYHLSVLAAHTENIDSIPIQMIRADFKLEIHRELIVFLILVFTLAIFLILFVLSLLHKKEQVYYLGDNDINHRFAYLVIVKTGDGYNSGTSSNVMIRLIGDKAASQPHVLNYPDPELRILQQFGRDVFLLATKNHLGDVKSVELWVDSIGQNPDWYCKRIRVCDLQEHTQWFFQIKKRLSVSEKNMAYVLCQPTERKTRRKFPLLRYHIWYLWQNEENLSYIKKLTISLSSILTTYSVALFLHGQPSLKLDDVFDQSFQSIMNSYVLFVAFTCSFPTFMVHFTIAWCFRFSENQFSRYDQDKKLSFRYNIACWCILLSLIVVATIYLTILGFWVPPNKSLVWVMTVVIGILSGILIYETVFLLVANFFWNYESVFDVRKKFADICMTVEKQRRYLFAMFGNQLLRSYFQHLYLPLKKKQIKRLSAATNHRRFVISELQDLLMFSVYIIILYILILANKDILVVHGKMEMKDVMEGKHTRTMNFKDMQTANSIYRYLNETLIPSTQPLRWYAQYVISEPGLMVDVTNKYIGITRLRQHRIESNVCEIPKIMEFLNTTCWPEYSQRTKATKTYGYRWGNFSIALFYDRLKHIWMYKTNMKTATAPTFGEFNIYSGGGYIAYLGRTLHNSYYNFQKLFKKIWVDHETRAVFIEFLIYNANSNIFSSVRLTFEHSATGFISKTVFIHTVRMLFVNNEIGYISSVFFVLFILWVSVLLVKQSVGVIKHLHNFYKDVWLMIDFVIISLSIMCIVLYGLRIHFLGIYMSAMEKAKHNEFLSYFYLFYIENFLTSAAAFLVCVATIRMWKFLRFAKMFRIMESTMGLAMTSLLFFSIYFIIILVASAMTVFILAGEDFARNRTLGKVMRLMFTMALKSNEMRLGQYTSEKLAVFYIVVYAVALKMCFLIVKTILLIAYAKAQWKFSSQRKIYNVKDYVRERSHYLTQFWKYKSKRLRAGLANVLEMKVEPKSDKFMYLNSYSVSVSRMRQMMYITQGLVRNKNRKPSTLTTRDITLMESICLQIFLKSGKDEVDVFFKGRVQRNKFKLVDEKRIEKIANVTNLLLQEQEVVLSVQEEEPPLHDECVTAIKQQALILRQCKLNLKIILQNLAKAESYITRM